MTAQKDAVAGDVRIVTCPDCRATIEAAAFVAPFEMVEIKRDAGKLSVTAVLMHQWDQSWHASSCPVLNETMKTAEIDVTWVSNDPSQLRVRRATVAEKLVASALAGLPAATQWDFAMSQVKAAPDRVLVGLSAIREDTP